MRTQNVILSTFDKMLRFACRYRKTNDGSHFPETVLYKDQAHIMRQPQGGDYTYSHVWEVQQQPTIAHQGASCGSTMCSFQARKTSPGGCGTAGDHLAMTLKGRSLLASPGGRKEHIYESPRLEMLPDCAITTGCAAGDVVPTPDFHQPMCAAHPQNPQVQGTCESQNIQNEATLSRGTGREINQVGSPQKSIIPQPVTSTFSHMDECIEGLKGDYIPATGCSSEESDDQCTDPLTGRRGFSKLNGNPTVQGYRQVPVNPPTISSARKKPAPPIRSVSNADRNKMKI